ncbi:MAG: PAS domain S-box protein, partial [Candidatus Omnitrophica bacterium]|nr:PAS domain S-box protein [Candidatus Omnitrophota bacterium]
MKKTNVNLQRRILRESGQGWKAVFDNSQDGILVADMIQKQFLSCNEKIVEMLGYSETELLSLAVKDVHPPGELNRVLTVFRRMAEGRLSIAADVPMRRKNGSVFYADISGACVKFSGRKCLVGFFRDVTERKKAEEALVESEEMFRILSERSPNMIFINQAGKVVYANPKCEEVMGYTSREFSAPQFNFLTLMHPEDIPAIRRNFLAHQQGKEVAPYEYKMITKTGKVIHAILTTKLIRYHDAPAILGIITDITKRKREEEAIKAAEEELAAIYQNAPILMMLVDEDRTVRKVNGFATEFTGRPASEVIGLRSGEVLRCLHSLESPKGCGFGKSCKRCIIRHTILDTLKTGQSHHQVEVSLPILADAERKFFTFLLSTTRLKVRERSMALVSILDISGRKRAEAAMQDSETKYRRLFEAAKDGVLILDAGTGRIEDVNPFLVKLLGYSHKAFLGKKIWELGSFRNIVANKANFSRLQRKKYIRYENLPLETADGRSVNVEFVSNVYRVNHHKVIQCNIRDITDRKRAREDLERLFSLQKATLESTADGILVVD